MLPQTGRRPMTVVEQCFFGTPTKKGYRAYPKIIKTQFFISIKFCSSNRIVRTFYNFIIMILWNRIPMHFKASIIDVHFFFIYLFVHIRHTNSIYVERDKITRAQCMDLCIFQTHNKNKIMFIFCVQKPRLTTHRIDPYYYWWISIRQIVTIYTHSWSLWFR